jgi:hypothetical protein
MDYDKHLIELREIYYRSYPKQRLGVAMQRIQNPDHGPNLLVTYVSAIEGLLRSLVIWAETTDGRPNEKIYNKYKNTTVKKLYSEYRALKNCGDLVPPETLKLVDYAVEYRNLLAHECTYLGQDKYPDLIAACKKFLDAIAQNMSITNP